MGWIRIRNWIRNKSFWLHNTAFYSEDTRVPLCSCDGHRHGGSWEPVPLGAESLAGGLLRHALPAVRTPSTSTSIIRCLNISGPFLFYSFKSTAFFMFILIIIPGKVAFVRFLVFKHIF